MPKRRRRPKRRMSRRRSIRFRGRRNVKIDMRGFKRLAIIIAICWGTWNLLGFMYGNLYSVVMNFASNQAVNIATAAISEGILRSEMGAEDPRNFITPLEDGSPLVNNMLINNYLANISREIVDIMQHVQQGDLSPLGLESFQGESDRSGVLFEIPWAAAFNLTLFHDVGPRFPVRANMMGNVQTDVEIQIESYGINQAVMIINLLVRTDLQVALPFRSQIEPVEMTLPIVTTHLRGDIPQFYWNSSGDSQAVAPPIILTE